MWLRPSFSSIQNSFGGEITRHKTSILSWCRCFASVVLSSWRCIKLNRFTVAPTCLNPVLNLGFYFSSCISFKVFFNWRNIRLSSWWENGAVKAYVDQPPQQMSDSRLRHASSTAAAVISSSAVLSRVHMSYSSWNSQSCRFLFFREHSNCNWNGPYIELRLSGMLKGQVSLESGLVCCKVVKNSHILCWPWSYSPAAQLQWNRQNPQFQFCTSQGSATVTVYLVVFFKSEMGGLPSDNAGNLEPPSPFSLLAYFPGSMIIFDPKDNQQLSQGEQTT